MWNTEEESPKMCGREEKLQNEWEKKIMKKKDVGEISHSSNLLRCLRLASFTNANEASTENLTKCQITSTVANQTRDPPAPPTVHAKTKIEQQCQKVTGSARSLKHYTEEIKPSQLWQLSCNSSTESYFSLASFLSFFFFNLCFYLNVFFVFAICIRFFSLVLLHQ